jgi:hypothetical protein
VSFFTRLTRRRQRRLDIEALESRTLLTFQFASGFSLPSNIEVEKFLLDGQDDIYIAGTFEGTANFDPNPTHPPLTITTANTDTYDGFVAKYSAAGALLWVHPITSQAGGEVDMTGLAIDPGTGAVYTVGTIYGSIDFDPGATNLGFATGNTRYSVVMKLTAQGSIDSDLIREFGGSSDTYGGDIAFDTTGDFVYMTGAFAGTDRYLATGTPTLIAASATDAFVLKLDANLHYLWGRSGGLATSSDDPKAFDAISIAVGGNGSIVIAGTLGVGGAGNHDFIEKFASSGEIVGLDEFGPADDEAAILFGLVVDSSGNVYVDGVTAGTFTLNFGRTVTITGPPNNLNLNALLIKFDPSLNVVWDAVVGGAGGHALAIDSSNDLYMAGTISGPASYVTSSQPGMVTPIAASPDNEPFILKVDGNGHLVDSAVGGGLGATDAIFVVGPSGMFEAFLGGFESDSQTFVRITEFSPALVVAPVFLGETRVVVKVGKRHKKKETFYQLNFSGPLSASAVENTILYHVTQIKKRGKHGTKSKSVGVTSAFYNSSTDSVSLSLGKFVKNQPLSMTASDLIGANGATVAPINSYL